MTAPAFNPGDRVNFTTAGRYRTEQSGVYRGMDENGRFAQVEVDGKIKKTRPSTLRAG